MALKERTIIDRIRALFPEGAELTDDCGLLPPAPPDERLLVTTDLMESERHFRLDWHPPELLGRKLLAANLSDLDASGATPLAFTLTLALGPEVEEAWLEAFLGGLAASAAEQGVRLAGGDTVGRERGLGLGITAWGSARRHLHRRDMRAGDAIFTDGMPGASLRGLRKLRAGQRWDPAAPDPDLAAHLDPRPRMGLGRRLAEMEPVHACIDLSDGLSKDLVMLAEAAGLSVVMAPDLPREALLGGEDYLRCFSASAGREELEALLGVPLVRVGQAIPRREAPLLHYDGRVLQALPDLSFDHFAP